MKRSLFVVAIGIAALALACNEATGPRSGGISLNLLTVGAGATGGTQAALDGFRVKVTGPTNKTMDFTCTATTCEGTVDGLDPGSYTLVVMGLVGGAVDRYAQTGAITVTAGQNTPAAISSFPSFQPVLTIGTDTTEVLEFPVSFSAVSAATSYVLEWSKAQDFSGAKADTLTVTADTIAVADTGRYYVRVRAVNAVVTNTGRASSPQTVFVTQGVATVTVTPATANVAAGATQQFAAAAKDANGTAVANVTFYWASSDPTIATVTQTGLATGVAGAGGAVTITAIGKGQPGSAALTVGAQTPTKLVFSVQPSGTVAGAAVSPGVQVEVRDANDNIVKTARDPVTVAFGNNAGGGALYGTKVINAINGIASFSGLWVDKAAAGYTLAASSGSLTGATSTAFDVTAAAPAKLRFSAQPSNVQGKVAISPAVTVTINDLYDNQTTANDQVTISLAADPWETPFSKGATLGGTLQLAASNGAATFTDVSVDKPGPGYELAANASGLTAAISDTFGVHLTSRQVALGLYYTCARTAGGTAPDTARVFCWGQNSYGQLGDSTGTIAADSSPRAVRQPASGGPIVLVFVTDGYYHSCGLTETGAAYCWGRGYEGQLGNGSSTNSTLPVAVSGGHVFKSITAGYLHTCAVTKSSATAAEDRQVYCWGYDGQGQLGDGGVIPGANQPTPIRVVQPLQTTAHADSVKAGGYHTCAWVQGGNGYCWGNDYEGELGDAAVLPAANKSTPTAIAGGYSWISMGGGSSHTCGVVLGGAGYCWGYNYYGQLGNNAAIPGAANTSTPASVYGGLVFSSIAAGQIHSCGLTTTAGAVYCWGYNNDGELGDDNAPNWSSARVQVAGGLSFTSVAAGGYHSCGMVGNKVYCWGRNNYGQIGDGARTSYRGAPVLIVQ